MRLHMAKIISNVIKFNDSRIGLTHSVAFGSEGKLQEILKSVQCLAAGKEYEGSDSDAVRLVDNVLEELCESLGMVNVVYHSYKPRPGYNAFAIIDLILVPHEGIVQPMQKGKYVPEFHELIGDISQDILYCSYNEDEVRELWNKGVLNALIKERSDQNPSEMLLKDWLIEDGDYESYITYLAKLSNGWPIDYNSDVNSYAPLTHQERTRVDEFDMDAYTTTLAAQANAI